MNVLIVSGIWPPDVGGPASHAPEVAAFLRSRGHDVEVVTTAERAPAPEEYPVRWVSRSRPPGLRHAEGVRLVRERARRADVVYTTGMFGRSSLGALLARTPFVVKLTADPAYERARRFGLWRGSLEGFQEHAPLTTLPLRLARDADVRRAAHVVTPSAYLRELALGWGVPLVIAGDGPDRDALERLGYARFLGPQPRQRVLELFRAADASLLSSSWENFPHTVVEALAVGTPVIATRTGGVAEVVHDGVNGLVVAPDDVDALAQAIERFVSDAALAGRLRAEAAASVAEYAPERVYTRLEEIMAEAAR